VAVEFARQLAGFGGVERWAVWAVGADNTAVGDWRGARPIALAALRKHGMVRALARRDPLSVARYYRRDLRRTLSRLPPVDVAVLSHMTVSQYAPFIRARRQVILAHNVEADQYARATRLEQSFLKRVAWRREAARMRRYEMQALRAADAVICLGSRDQQLILELYGVKARAWYPSVGDVHLVGRRSGSRRTVGWIGSATWQPNRWGLDWLVARVWPTIRGHVPEAELRLAGEGTEVLPYREADGIRKLGRVLNADEFYSTVDVVVTPVFGGGGLKIKVLDAAARGLPVVATCTAGEGLGSQLPHGVRAIDDPQAFAGAVCGFLDRPDGVPVMDNATWYRALVEQGEAALVQAFEELGLT
jgi:glycosyltransferase involved in cell wall biosynthesis